MSNFSNGEIVFFPSRRVIDSKFTMRANVKCKKLPQMGYIMLILLFLLYESHIVSSKEDNPNLVNTNSPNISSNISTPSLVLNSGNKTVPIINDTIKVSEMVNEKKNLTSENKSASHTTKNQSIGESNGLGITTSKSLLDIFSNSNSSSENRSAISTTEKVITTSDKISANTTEDAATVTQSAETINAVNTSTAAPVEPVLPDKGSAEEEHNSSMSIFFVLCVLALGILLIHLMLQTNFRYLPESVVIVFLGGAIGMTINMMSHQNIANWRKEEAFSPTAFFLVLLPPIIFESGYNLHKGNFFQNIGSILVFAIFGTAISAFVIGAGIYLLGLAEVAYKLSFVESFAFGSLISAVDPVATVAIFHALDVDPVLNMLVFGESILNDAISIVLTTSVLESNNASTTSEAIILGINRFCLMFFASAGIGVVFALISALLLKHIDLRKNPSLEFGLMLVFTYAPYVLAEGIHLSGENTNKN